MAGGSLAIPVVAGFAAGIVLIASVIILSVAAPTDNNSIYEAVRQDLAREKSSL